MVKVPPWQCPSFWLLYLLGVCLVALGNSKLPGRGPIPRILTVLEPVASKVAHFTTFDHPDLEDGVEENNVIEYNLAAHVHVIGTPAWSSNQFIDDVYQTDDLLLPADVTASGFYITNANNSIIGNAASGGWAGFALPELPRPVMAHRAQSDVTPSSRTFLAFDGNTAHSTGFWWHNAGAIYVGGKLWHPNAGSDELRYNPG